MVLPARSASCSVARRIQSARTAMATMLVRKTQVGGATTSQRRATDTGTNSRSA